MHPWNGRMSSLKVILQITKDDVLEICFEIVAVGRILKSKHSVTWIRTDKIDLNEINVKDMCFYIISEQINEVILY